MTLMYVYDIPQATLGWTRDLALGGVWRIHSIKILDFTNETKNNIEGCGI